MKTWVFVSTVVISALLIVGVSLYKYAMDSPWRISAEEAKKRISEKKVDTVLDVRTKMERDTLGFYPNSLHIPAGELDGKIQDVITNRNARILVYCNTGQRARAATEKLRELGYKNVVYISGAHTSIM